MKEEKEVKARLAAEVQFLMDQIHKMKVERSKMIAEKSEKVDFYNNLTLFSNSLDTNDSVFLH